MKKLKKLPLLAVSLLLAACGPTSEPTTSEQPSEPATSVVDPTTSITVPSTETTTNPTDPSISNPNNEEYKNAVQEKIGSLPLFKNFIKGLSDEPIVKVNFTTSTTGSYSNEESQIETMFRSDEVYSVSTNIDHKTGGDEIEKETTYVGIVDGLLYDASLSTNEIFSNVKRYKIADSKEFYQTDIITQDEANAKVDEVRATNNLSCLSSYGYWDTVVANEKFVQTSYDLTINDKNARVVIKGYQEKGSKLDITLIANFDEDVKLESGTLSVDRYTTANWDTENHKPADTNKTTSKQKVSLDGVEYGEPLKTSNKTMIDLSKYFVNTLCAGIVISNFVSDPLTGRTVYSENNEVFANQPVDCPVDYIMQNKLYSPETALDVSSLYITGASKDGFLKSDGYGWVIKGEIGEKATLYIGNSFNEKLAEVEVTIVQSPIKNNPMINPSIFGVSGNNYEYNKDSGRPTLTITSTDTIVMAISTYNAGPFDSYPISFWTSESGIISAKLCEDQEQYYEAHQANAIYFEITALKSGSTVFAITDSSTGEGHAEISITVTL